MRQCEWTASVVTCAPMAVRSVTIGRYALYDEIASGGMASVHLGRLLGPVGFARTVAIKRLHAHLARDPDFVAMFLDEARLAARIRHPNVVSTLDVVATDGELFVVMEYVLGDSLARLLREARTRAERVPLSIAAAIMVNVLHGLHAAHEAKNEKGETLGLVHRDVSPQNVLVGADGAAHVIDFGVAKAGGRAQITRDGQLKGKLSYMAPEQLRAGAIDRRVDVFGASIVFWEALTGERLFDGEGEGVIYGKVLRAEAVPPSTHVADLGEAVDRIVMRGLSLDPKDRFASAREMALAIESALPLATPTRVAHWVERLMAETLSVRRHHLAQIESVVHAGDEAPIFSAAAMHDSARNIPTAPGGRMQADSLLTEPDARALFEEGALSTASLVSPSFDPEPRPRASRRSIAAIAAVALLFGVAMITELRPKHAANVEPAVMPVPSAAPQTQMPTSAPPIPIVPILEPDGLSHALSSAPSAAIPVVTTAPSALHRAPSRRPAPRISSPASRANEAQGKTAPNAASPPIAQSPPVAPVPATATAIDCDPPYIVNADGTKRYKRECASR